MTKPIFAALIGNMIPIVSLVLSIAYQTERINKLKTIAICLSFAMITYLVLSNGSNGARDFGSSLGLGNFYIFLNIICFSFAFVLSKKLLMTGFPHKVLSGLMLFIGGVFLASLSFAQLPEVMNNFNFNTLNTAYLFYEIFVSTALVYYLNIWATGELEVSTVSFFIYF